ncbi:Hypothetical protein I595_2824 [Croceitalea dokdonensis DOKDO 023]|uniref:DUF4836 family protein n=1 Tax=Croceitalea dokdonensis DOKDO 023 TaxID=1300341 RepID=A0A0P7APJ7_9FLAO|nr:hypothetical protein [Croceitalea dokdonensis]KPM30847.1 Hypothetical protein I595_2824 [Croceitalea dokdonensis DOKDO 023]
MKILRLLFICCAGLAMHAQDLAKKIPSNAQVVVTIKGENVLDLMSLEEFSNSKIGTIMGDELKRDTKGEFAAIWDLNLDLTKNFYYYLETKKGVFYNVFLIPFTNTSSINTLMRRERDRIITEGNISYLQEDYDDVVLMWDSTNAVVVIPSDQNKEPYDDYGFYDYEPYIPPAVENSPTGKGAEGVAEEAVAPENYYESDAYKKEQEAREKRGQERRAKRKEAKRALKESTIAYAKKVLTETSATNILQNPAYKKSLGKGKDEMMVWMNDFSEIYKNALPASLMGPSNPYEYLNLEELYSDMAITARLNFEKDQAVLDLDYIMNDLMAKTYKPMYDGKFNKNFLNYFNEDRLLGYMSINLSTQGILEAYPTLMERMFSNVPNTGDTNAETISAAVTSVSRLFSLLIDEEGAAKILRGDMLLLLTDLREKEVTYTDYEYDEDYNYKEVTKTKTETVPDFLFLFTSDEVKMFHNFMKIGVQEGKVTHQNGIYSIPGSSSTPFDIYAMYHDNTVFFGSSKVHLTQIRQGTYISKSSPQLKKDMGKNAMSLYVNGKNIISEIPTEAFPRELQGNLEFLTKNTKDMRINFSKIKGNRMSGEMVLKTPVEGHKNSLQYFLNMIEQLMD